MNFLVKLDRLMDERGLNKHTLSQQCGIPYTTIVGMYERGVEKARLTNLMRLCDFFNVPIDYMVYDRYESPEDFIPKNVTPSFICREEDEIALVKNYRKLNAEGKDSASNVIKGMTTVAKYREEPSKSEMA